MSEAGWAELPSLADVGLSPEEIFSEILISQETFIEWRDVSDELQTECLIDCAKIIMQTTSRDMTHLTILLMRMGSPDEAQR